MTALSSRADIQLVSVVSQIQQTRYAELASSVIVIYDHLVTLDQEIELIWVRTFDISRNINGA
ncbi:hypothetical protein OE88DRAFT_1665914 [Heliocybe sulcata]|uniref:DUF6533 domain-containing protein n=1 Tax=Heliocybe sulcata TaxID=5364 RepID=A0A5C3MRK6_9AGAM|nr:hypothetical protein OE88DRAFT_1665914 [Heliocybe sulcata]